MALLAVYTKPDCPLCAGLVAKLTAIQPELGFTLELRDITTRDDWQERYQYRIPVLEVNGRGFPSPQPRITNARLAALLGPALRVETP